MFSSIEEYLEKFCKKHNCSKREALDKLVVQEYIKDIHDRGYYEQIQSKEDNTRR